MPARAPIPADRDAVLAVRSLVKRYGRFEAVRGIDLSVPAGSIYGLLGPNGSGKTTTMACALGLLRPTSGSVELLGRPAARIHELRGRVAALFDDPTLVRTLTVRQNLEYARRLGGGAKRPSAGRGVDAALERAGLRELAGQRASGLSLGQSRRLAIARLLLGEPELLVLDEPLSGLDTVGVLEVLDLLPLFAKERYDTGGQDDEKLFLDYDMHWTPRGCRLASDAIAERVRELPWYEEGTLEEGEDYLVVKERAPYNVKNPIGGTKPPAWLWFERVTSPSGGSVARNAPAPSDTSRSGGTTGPLRRARSPRRSGPSAPV